MSGEVSTIYDDAPYWAAFEEGELQLPWCTDCARPHLPPGPACPYCLSESLEWRTASGRGELASWVVERRKWFAAYDPPYAAGQVELEEGPRLTARLSMTDVPNLQLGSKGQIKFEIAPNGMRLPIFVLDARSS